MNLKKTAAALLAAVMAVSFTACASKNVSWIATNNGEQVPAGIYLDYMVNAYYEAASKTEKQGKDVLKEQIDGVSGSAWIQNKTDEDFKKYIAVTNKAAEEGMALTDEEIAQIDAQVHYQWQMMGRLFEQNGVSYESFLAVSHNDYLLNKAFENEYGTNGKNPVSDADLLKAFQENYFRVRTITMSLNNTDGTAKDEAAQQKVMDKANEILGKVNSDGSNYLDVILEYEKEQAASRGEDASTVHEHTETSHVSYMQKGNINYTQEMMDAIEAMGNNEVKVLTSNSMVYVLQKLDISSTTAEDMSPYRTGVLQMLKGDEFDATVQSWADATTVDYNAEAKNYYKPEKLKLTVKRSSSES